jgi:hypothetical protein
MRHTPLLSPAACLCLAFARVAQGFVLNQEQFPFENLVQSFAYKLKPWFFNQVT